MRSLICRIAILTALGFSRAAMANVTCACQIFFGGGAKSEGSGCEGIWYVSPCNRSVTAFTYLSACFTNEIPQWPEGGEVAWSISSFRGIKWQVLENLTYSAGFAIQIELDGSVAEIDCGTMTVTATELGGAGRQRSSKLSVRIQPECGGDGCAGLACYGPPGQGSSGPGSARIDVALGKCAFGKPVGGLTIHEDNPGPALSTPATLRYNYDTNLTGCEVITNLAGIKQVLAKECIVNVEVIDAYQYNLVVYPTNAIVAKTNGVYQLSGAPLKTLSIVNPDGASSTNRVQFIDEHTSTLEWRTNGWERLAANNTVRQRRAVDTSGNVTISTWEFKNADNDIVAKWQRSYATNAGVRKITQEIMGTGADATTTTYEYYSGGTADGLLSQVNHADGGWEINHYDTNRLLVAKFVAFQNEAPTTNAALCRKFTYFYGTNVVAGSGDPGKFFPTDPRLITEHLLGKEISRRYMIRKRGRREDHVCLDSNSTWQTAANLTTIRTWHTNGTDGGRLKNVRFPDGTYEVYQYLVGPDGRTNTVLRGYSTNGVDVTDGVKTVTVKGFAGRLEKIEAIEIASGKIIAREVHTDPDGYNRPRKVTFLDGTYTWSDFGCCGPVTQSARDGTETENFFDELRRQVGTKNNGITTANILDAHGQTLRTIRIGTNGSEILQAAHLYNTAGELLATTNALGAVSLHTEWMTNNYRVHKTTYPDESTREETFYRDGQLAKVTGTATRGARYVHGVMEVSAGVGHPYTAEIKLDEAGADTAEVVTNLFDFAGRNYKTLYGDGNSRQTLYNAKGQRTAEIDPDGVRKLYAYNNRGEVEFVATDMDQDGNIDFGATSGDNDRIGSSVTSYTTKGSQDVRQTKSYSWFQFNSASSNLVAVRETTTDGLTTWTSGNGVTNRSDLHFPSSRDGNRYSTNTAPDGSYTVTHFFNGVPQSTTRKDSSDNQLSKTTYTYDAHGRQSAVTDARNGTTTYAYDDDDRRVSVTSPAPGTGQGAQTTSFEFDDMGRLTRMTYADGTSLTNEYLLTGELKKTVGSRSYPVEYEYTDQGRIKKMHTWMNYSGNGGKATTTWQYDAKRGWMTNKVYEGQSTSVAYHYTPAGRLQKRRWERGLWTTNTFNNAGEIVGVKYSDGQTASLTYHLDRVGRTTNIVDAIGSRLLMYSEAGLLLSEKHTSGSLSGLRLTNTYNSFLQHGSLSFFTNSGGAVFTHSYGYGTASRLTNVSDGTYSAAYFYLANSPLVDHIIHRENSTTRMTRTNRYDLSNGLLDVSSHPAASGEKAVQSTYTYNQANQRVRVADVDGTYWLYEYDELGQLVSGKRFWADGTPVAGQQFEYQFDDIGNRQSAKAGGDDSGLGLRQSDYSVNTLNQYVSRTVPGKGDVIGIAHAEAAVTVNGQSPYRKGEYYWRELSLDNSSAPLFAAVTNRATKSGVTNTTTGNLFLPKTPEILTYDADGNTTSDGRWTNRWDAENRLITMEALASVPSAARKKLTFTYDNHSRRISKTVSNWTGSAWTFGYQRKFVYDGWNLVAELDGNNNLVRSYLWGTDLSGGMQGAGGVGGLIAIKDATEGTHFVCYDGNGNVTALVKGTDGTTSTRYEYDPFGRTIRATGTLATKNPYRFSTKYTDEESEWLYYGYRFYDPEKGRWPSRDPEEAPDAYAMTANDVINSVDMLGLYERSPTVFHHGVANSFYDGRQLIGYPTTRFGMTHAHIFADEVADFRTSVYGMNNCHCKLDSVNIHVTIDVYIPAVGDIMTGDRRIPTKATQRTVTASSQHEMGHVFHSQWVFDTLFPMLESSCTGKVLDKWSGWTGPECRKKWVSIIEGHGKAVSKYNRGWHDRWHAMLGKPGRRLDYLIPEATMISFAEEVLSALSNADSLFDFCDTPAVIPGP